MSSIKKISERKYKITVSNGYKPDGKKISRAKTVTVPYNIGKSRIMQFVSHEAEMFERLVKYGFSEDAEITFEEYAEHWLERHINYAVSTRCSYRRMLAQTYPYIGQIKLCQLRPMEANLAYCEKCLPVPTNGITENIKSLTLL